MEEEDSNVVEEEHGSDNQREERKVVSDGANTGNGGNLMQSVVTSVRAGWGARSIPPTADAALAVEDRVVRY